jgi:hypothetical protein
VEQAVLRRDADDEGDIDPDLDGLVDVDDETVTVKDKVAVPDNEGVLESEELEDALADGEKLSEAVELRDA